MKVIATIEADFRESPLGTVSRLGEALCGETVLRRTVKRLLAAKRITSVHVITEPTQRDEAEAALGDLDVRIEVHEAGPVPWQSYIRSARKWALDGWRGGLSDSTVFDESTHIWVLDALAKREQADGVVPVPAAAALIDPKLLDQMIDHFETVRDEMRLTFTQSAPGLSAAIYLPELLSNMAKSKQSTGRMMAYSPSEPRIDLLTKPCFYPVADTIAHAHGRCIADTQRTFNRMSRLCDELSNDEAIDATAVSRWLMDHYWDDVCSLPGEVEIELTTDDPLPESTLRPRGQAVGRRGPMAPAVFGRLVDELAQRDDVRIVLGGYGDPLMHPQWPELIERCRSAGIFGIAVRTPAVHLDERAIEVLAEHRVDVLNVLIDAHSAETYHRVHRADHFDAVMANLERAFESQKRLGRPQPIVVCEMIKAHETIDEMEAFYDYWLRRTGTGVIAGPSHYSRQWPDRAVMSMAPPTRFPCARVFDRAMVLADGRVTACDQDFRGDHAVGSIAQNALEELWVGERMADVRRSHVRGTYDAMALCGACDEWHRP